MQAGSLRYQFLSLSCVKSSGGYTYDGCGSYLGWLIWGVCHRMTSRAKGMRFRSLEVKITVPKCCLVLRCADFHMQI